MVWTLLGGLREDQCEGGRVNLELTALHPNTVIFDGFRQLAPSSTPNFSTSEPTQQSRKVLRLDFFVCGFLAQCTLADSLSMSAEFGTVLGITGPVWYAIAAQMPVVLFTIILVRFRMIAPGARTFLHVVNGRFGRTAHILLCVLALSNNVSFVVRVIGNGNKIFATISSGVTFNLVWIVNITIAAIFVGCANLRQAFLVSSVGAVFILISTLVFFVGVFFKSNDPNLG
nr:urea transporter [Hymenolepis microstoma]